MNPRMNPQAIAPLLLLSAVTLTNCQPIEFNTSVANPVNSSATATNATIMLKGEQLKGASFYAVDEQGNRLDFQIQSVELDPEDPDQEIYLYTVLVRDSINSQWQNLCEPDRNNLAKAIPLQGAWDEAGNYIESAETITFGCTSGVLAKCVRFGYKPWKTVEGRSLRDFHQACTRMVRADYCGNGNPHTREGTPIDIYDALNIQSPTPNSGMVFEAAWTPDGAVFVNRTRWSETAAAILQECPEKLNGRVNQSDRLMTVEQVQQSQLNTTNVLLFNDSFVQPQ